MRMDGDDQRGSALREENAQHRGSIAAQRARAYLNVPAVCGRGRCGVPRELGEAAGSAHFGAKE